MHTHIFAWERRDIWQRTFLSPQKQMFSFSFTWQFMSRKWGTLFPFFPSLVISDMHLATQSGILCLQHSAAGILSESLKSTLVPCLSSSSPNPHLSVLGEHRVVITFYKKSNKLYLFASLYSKHKNIVEFRKVNQPCSPGPRCFRRIFLLINVLTNCSTCQSTQVVKCTN